MRVRVAQDQEGVHLTVPKPALDFLKSLAPLAAALAKLGDAA